MPGKTDRLQRSCLKSLDMAQDYIREYPGRVFPGYIIAMLPYTLAMLLLIDSVCTHHLSALPLGCLYLTVATIWRWIWTATVQRRIQQDIRGETPPRLRSVMLGYLAIRLTSYALISWGSLAIFPAFYGFFFSAFAAPMLLEGTEAPKKKILRTIALLHREIKRLCNISLVLLIGTILLAGGLLGLHFLLLNTVFPSIMGLDVTELSLTINGMFWTLFAVYALFLVIDFYWTVAAVFVFYDLRSRRLGSDLRLRLQKLEANG